MTTKADVEVNERLIRFGFKSGRNGAHAARTMMVEELRATFAVVPERANRDRYVEAIVEENVLSKPTLKARTLTARHLIDLYGMDLSIPIFRVLRRLWTIDPESQPLLALMVALARDPLLRLSWPFVVGKKPGDHVSRQDIERILAEEEPGRFSPASLKSFAQNVNGTWTQSGHLSGKAFKVRSSPHATAVSFTMAAVLTHIEGLHGQVAMQSRWMRLLDKSIDGVTELGKLASRRGLVVFMSAGGVTEIRVPGYLTTDEERAIHESP